MLGEIKIAIIQILLSVIVFLCWLALYKNLKMDGFEFLILVQSVLYVSIMFWLIRTRTDR